MAEDAAEDMALGGNITLSGFKDISKQELIVVKKIVGSYARKLSDNVPDFQELKVNMKAVHKTEASEKYELHCSVFYGGEHFDVEVVERNLFMGLDEVLRKVTEHAMKDAQKRG
ncbi:hypothetical protein JW711_03025 [Candidatus Woesearchaeota archaeon]|nr:hypothetical protein [Candidatus Woesearchaeota archaeon]